MEIIEILKNKTCLAVIFIVSLLSVALIWPYFEISLFSILMALIFVILFSFYIACTVRKLRIEGSKRGMIGLISSIFGFTSLQTCLISGVCLVNIPLILSLLPLGISILFIEHSFEIFVASIILLIFSLYFMGCFKRKKIEKKLIL